MAKETKYVVHYCKNPKCDNAWIDEDLTNAKTRPPRWKYCAECCEKMGIDFNAQVRPKKKLSKKQVEVLQNNKFCKRKKSNVTNENYRTNIQGGKNEIKKNLS